MDIYANVKLFCPEGFYCKNKTRYCPRLLDNGGGIYECSVFVRFLKSDSKGNVIKCSECVEAERNARIMR